MFWNAPTLSLAEAPSSIHLFCGADMLCVTCTGNVVFVYAWTGFPEWTHVIKFGKLCGLVSLTALRLFLMCTQHRCTMSTHVLLCVETFTMPES